MVFGINTPSRTLGCFLEGNGLLLTHSRDDRDQKFLSIVKFLLDVYPKLTLGDLDIIFRSPV